MSIILVRFVERQLVKGITLRSGPSPKTPQEEENESPPCSILFTGYQCHSRSSSSRPRCCTASHFSSAACFLSISAHSITASVPASASPSIARRVLISQLSGCCFSISHSNLGAATREYRTDWTSEHTAQVSDGQNNLNRMFNLRERAGSENPRSQRSEMMSTWPRLHSSYKVGNKTAMTLRSFFVSNKLYS